MKKISVRGYVYDVYDTGDGRVLKEKPAILQYILHSMHGRAPSYIQMHKDRARLIAGSIPDKELIGNPIFLNKRSYTQDKVEALDDFLKAHSLEENKAAVDAYIQSVFDTWQHGFSDLIFNFSRNNGVAKNGRVILFDFNEVTFKKSEAAGRLKNSRWIKTLSYYELPNGELKEYYASAMKKAMTMDNLDRYWKDNPKLHE